MTKYQFKSPSFETTSEKLEYLWDELQILQADFAFTQELSVYYQSNEWHNADKVLDVGCGNGHYLFLLSEYFPEKNYVGIDFSKELIHKAKKRDITNKFEFIVSDFFEVDDVYDVIIMRLFMQHLPDPDKILKYAEKLLKPGGSLIIIDSQDKFRHYHPAMPEFSKFFETYRSQQHSLSLDRDVVSKIPNCIEHNQQWQERVNLDIIIPSTVPGNKELFSKVYSYFIDMVEAVGNIEYNFDLVRKDIEEWSKSDGYTQIGLKLLSITRL